MLNLNFVGFIQINESANLFLLLANKKNDDNPDFKMLFQCAIVVYLR